MHFQLLSNLWGRLPRDFRARAPLLVLAGNIGKLESAATWNLLKVLCRDFDKTFWIPHLAETFTESGRVLSNEEIRDAVHSRSKATLLSNDVVTYNGRTILGTSGWWPGDMAPYASTIHKWGRDDLDFVHENSGPDSILITGGTMKSNKPAVIINGSARHMEVNYNRLVTLDSGRTQRQICNSAINDNFYAQRHYELV